MSVVIVRRQVSSTVAIYIMYLSQVVFPLPIVVYPPRDQVLQETRTKYGIRRV